MKKVLRRAIEESLLKVDRLDGIPQEQMPEVSVTRPKEAGHGDYSSTIALALAKRAKTNPAELAEAIGKELMAVAPAGLLAKVEVAHPGFINLFLSRDAFYEPLREIADRGPDFGSLELGRGVKVLLEFVSANPVGPLHLGHGRWAVVGDSLARIIKKAGFGVGTEFYVNDYGNQMELFGASLDAKYRELFGIEADAPEDGYKGVYIDELARGIKDDFGDEFLNLEERARRNELSREGSRRVLERMKEVLARIGVRFDRWFSETGLHASGAVRAAVAELEKAGATFTKDDAVWFRAASYGDQKDRVLIRSAGGGEEGWPTYFAADVAYHLDKANRGFDKLINVWGADHHGYVARVRAALTAAGHQDDFLEVVLGQLVNLFRGGQPVKMSKRTGDLVTLEELIDEVGADSVRFFFLMRSTDSPLDFDIDLAKKRSDENPVFYVQYAHARIASIIRFAAENGMELPRSAEVRLSLLADESERGLVRKLAAFEDVIESAAVNRAPHLLTQYARETATAFHLFYHQCRVVGNEDQDGVLGPDLDRARLFLAGCVKQVIANVCSLIGVSAPEKM